MRNYRTSKRQREKETPEAAASVMFNESVNFVEPRTKLNNCCMLYNQKLRPSYTIGNMHVACRNSNNMNKKVEFYPFRLVYMMAFNLITFRPVQWELFYLYLTDEISTCIFWLAHEKITG